MEFSMKVFFK